MGEREKKSKEIKTHSNSNMTTFAKRAKFARRQAGLTFSQAAKRIGVTPSTIQKCESDIIRNFSHIFEMASVYSVSPLWLKFGKEKNSITITRGKSTTEISENGQCPILSIYIPVLEWENVTKPVSKSTLTDENHADWVQFSGDASLETSFALRVKGNSMVSQSPAQQSFLPGDIILVDQSKELYDGCYVIAQLNKDTYLRQYMKDCTKYWLFPLNKQCKAMEFNEDVNVIGVVFSLRRDFNKPPIIPHVRKKEISKNKK